MKKLYISAMLEKFSFNGMSAMLVLYMVQYLHFNDADAFKIFSAVMAFGFIAPLFGGWLAEKVFSNQLVLIIGALFMSAGFYSLLFTFNDVFYLGLSAVTLGSGLIRSSVPAVLGNICKERGLHPDSAFTTLYVFINVGTLLGAIGCAVLGEIFGWDLSFIIAGTAMLFFIPLLAFENIKSSEHDKSKNLTVYCVLLVLVPIFLSFLIYNNAILNALLPTLIILSIGFMIIVTRKHYPEALGNIFVIIIFMMFQALFFALYNQENLFLILFAAKFVNHSFLSFLGMSRIDFFGMHVTTLPTTFFQTIDPAWNIIIGTALMFIRVTKKKYTSMQAFYKFLMGLVFITLGFLLLAIATHEAHNQLISPWWMIVAYALFVLGELFIIPIGLSFVSSLTPKKFSAQFMAIWYLSFGFSMWLAGVLSILTNKTNTGSLSHSYESIFMQFSEFGFVLICFLSITIFILKKINFKEITT